MQQGYVHDERHRFGLELRPDAMLDARIRAIAARLEEAGLVAEGMLQAPRFQPHVTLFRAAAWSLEACAAAAAAAPADVMFAGLGTFGGGRIAWLAPGDAEQLAAMRAAAMGAVDPAALDPAATARPWTPHVTVAYSIDEQHRPAALELITAALPITGRWATIEAWDLDVRPTVRVGSCSVN